MLKSGQLAQTHRLKLSEDLSEFPREIFDLAETLEILDLSGNQLSTLPNDFGRLHNLRIVFLSQNEFTELPSVLADCPKLDMIGFKSNRISHVPENALPTATRWLILTDNQIETLPNSMGDLRALQKLMLAGNRLESLPDSMANCRNLELMRISANRLAHLPEWIFQLPKLAWLAFSGNPFTQQSPSDLKALDNREVQVHEQLGEGASGWIHRATLQEPASAPKATALKLFKGDVTSDGYPHCEMHISSRVGEHPNLVSIMAKYHHEDQQGLVMELIEDAFRNLGLPPSFESCTRDTFHDDFEITASEIANIAHQVADAMDHLHQRQLCHGDLYSHNLLVNDESGVMLTDFGAATHYESLPVAQRERLESIEILAFGNLLDDLLQVCDASDTPHLHTDLIQLRDQCRQDDPALRPGFSEVCEMLDRVRNAHLAADEIQAPHSFA